MAMKLERETIKQIVKERNRSEDVERIVGDSICTITTSTPIDFHAIFSFAFNIGGN